MEYDLWRQWQAFAELMNPASKSRSAADAVPGFAPFADAAERFSGAARTFVDALGKSPVPAAADAARAFTDFLREQFADYHPPWAAGFGAAAGIGPGSSTDSPALGPNREQQQRWQRTAEAWGRMNDAQRRLQRLWSDALREAAGAFAAKSGQLQGASLGKDSLKKLYDTWIECAEEAYARTAHGEAFREALAEFVNAGSEWRKEMRTSVEHWSKQFDLPTRSEINSLNARLKALEMQLRAARPKPRTAAVKPKSKPTARGGRARRKP
ncbi:MAG: poly(R)-hydroxyalkanoic acid synthase subunit PhaE, partial [Steroidobacteraceae bacterium]